MKPILFSGPMVRAILEGKKTQTRRLVKDAKGQFWDHPGWSPVLKSTNIWTHSDGEGHWAPDFSCPYGQPGEVIWVRETWSHHYTGKGLGFHYRADFSDDPSEALSQNHAFGLMRWKPSIHMPRSACRLFLQITNVRVERLQEISESDARAEGVTLRGDPQATTVYDGIYREHFHRLWDSLNEDRAPWSENPWVWVVEFKRIEQGEIAA